MIYYSLLLFSNSTPSGEATVLTDTSAADAAQSETVGHEQVLNTGENDVPDAADAQTSEKTRREIYDEFIRAHKDLFAEDTQKIINRRFKEVKQTEEALKAAQAEIKSLSEQLERAYPEPCPPSDEFMASHPDLILERELENEIFALLYNSGVPFETVYNAVHANELIESARDGARKEAVKATLDSVRARGVRTRESAAASCNGTGIKRDVSKLTKGDRADIARRVMAGEKINFN